MDPSARKGELHQNAVQALRAMIVTGELAPGERLNERELCARLNVSRTPIREAIKTLAQDGLLQVWPNRSPVVMPLESAQTQALVEVVAAIEEHARWLADSGEGDRRVARRVRQEVETAVLSLVRTRLESGAALAGVVEEVRSGRMDVQHAAEVLLDRT